MIVEISSRIKRKIIIDVYKKNIKGFLQIKDATIRSDPFTFSYRDHLLTPAFYILI